MHCCVWQMFPFDMFESSQDVCVNVCVGVVWCFVVLSHDIFYVNRSGLFWFVSLLAGTLLPRVLFFWLANWVVLFLPRFLFLLHSGILWFAGLNRIGDRLLKVLSGPGHERKLNGILLHYTKDVLSSNNILNRPMTWSNSKEQNIIRLHWLHMMCMLSEDPMLGWETYVSKKHWRKSGVKPLNPNPSWKHCEGRKPCTTTKSHRYCQWGSCNPGRNEGGMIGKDVEVL